MRTSAQILSSNMWLGVEWNRRGDKIDIFKEKILFKNF